MTLFGETLKIEFIQLLKYEQIVKSEIVYNNIMVIDIYLIYIWINIKIYNSNKRNSYHFYASVLILRPVCVRLVRRLKLNLTVS